MANQVWRVQGEEAQEQRGQDQKVHRILYQMHTTVMRKQLTVELHLSLQEVEHRYRNAKDPVERSY